MFVADSRLFWYGLISTFVQSRVLVVEITAKDKIKWQSSLCQSGYLCKEVARRVFTSIFVVNFFEEGREARLRLVLGLRGSRCVGCARKNAQPETFAHTSFCAYFLTE